MLFLRGFRGAGWSGFHEGTEWWLQKLNGFRAVMDRCQGVIWHVEERGRWPLHVLVTDKPACVRAGWIASRRKDPIVMRTGGIVEAGDTRQIMSAPREPYTRPD